MNLKDELPRAIRKRAIEFAKEKTGLQRPHKSQTVYVEAFEECFKEMVKLGLVKQEIENGEKEGS